MKPEELRDLAVDQLTDLKGQDLVVCDVRDKTDVTDFFVIVTSTSNRHAKALADKVIEKIKQLGLRPLGVEGYETNEWILVDLGDVVVHVMQAPARKFYDLEGLWLNVPA